MRESGTIKLLREQRPLVGLSDDEIRAAEGVQTLIAASVKLLRPSWNRRTSAQARAGLSLLLMASIALLLSSPTRADTNPPGSLLGSVVGPDGKPAAGVLVAIAGAAPRAGRTSATPWCYPDVGRHTLTDSRGQFAFYDVDAVWLYEVFVEAKGFRPQSVRINPRNELPTLVRLFADDDPSCRVVGVILRPGGQPAAGRVVTVERFALEGAQVGDYPMDRAARTDAEGRFTIRCQQSLADVTVGVGDVGTTRRVQFRLTPGAKENKLQLVEGAIVTGRVLHRARRIEGVQVGLAGFSRQGRDFFESHQATTDRKGRFVIEGVHPGADFHLFTRMGSPEGQPLAAIPREIESPADRQMLDVGELNLHPAHHLTGRVICSDGKPAPEDLIVTLERTRGDDVQECAVDAHGRFSFDCVPSESVVLSFHTPGEHAVHGYRLSGQSFSLDYMVRATLCGRVDEDLEIVVLFEPGLSAAYIPGQLRRGERSWGADHRFGEQKRIEAAPLRGVPPELISRLEKRAQ